MQRWLVWAAGMACVAFGACSSSERDFGSNAAGAGGDAGTGGSTGGGDNDAAGTSAGTAPDALGGVGGEPVTAAAGAGGSGGLSGSAGAPPLETAGAGGEPPIVVEMTPPSVVMITPANAALGVASDTPVKVTFSEAMDTTSVEGALNVSSYNHQELDVSWASGGKVMSIVPSGGWKYATGTDPKLAALKLTVSIATTAKDAQGEALPAAFSSSFSTRRRLTQTFPASSVGSYSTYGHAVGDGPLMCASGTDNVIIEKWTSQASGGTYYAFVVFDTTALGAAADSHIIEGATFRATQTAPQGDFYATHQVVAAKLAHQAIDKDVLGAAITSSLGVFTNSAATVNASLNVLPSFKADFDAGQNKHLYRLAPDLGGADSTVAHFSCGAFALDVTHVLP